MKQLHTTLTIEEAIAITIHALEKGVAPIMAYNCLVMDGFEEERAEKIVQWARAAAKINNKENML